MRNTKSWKHNSKDRKQYIRNGNVRVFDDLWGVFYDTPITATPGFYKRNTPFMDLSDLDN